MYVSVLDGVIKTEQKEMPEDSSSKDMTGYIINPSFEGNTTTGWEGTNMTANQNEVEKWNANFNFHQTITGLPEGEYELACQGFYRDGSLANAVSHRNNDKEALNATLYAKSATDEASTPLPSILDEAGKKGAIGNSTTYGYVPNDMEQSAIYFADGLYPTKLSVKVGNDGELTIGVKKMTLVSNDWTIFDNFTLTYINSGSEDAITAPTSRYPFASSGTYTLSGVRVADNSDLPKGLYIINGKKVVLK